jgi:hypothetical protein
LFGFSVGLGELVDGKAAIDDFVAKLEEETLRG